MNGAILLLTDAFLFQCERFGNDSLQCGPNYICTQGRLFSTPTGREAEDSLFSKVQQLLKIILKNLTVHRIFIIASMDSAGVFKFNDHLYH